MIFMYFELKGFPSVKFIGEDEEEPKENKNKNKMTEEATEKIRYFIAFIRPIQENDS